MIVSTEISCLLFNLLSFCVAMGWVSHSAALWFGLPILQFYGFSIFRRLPFASLSFARVHDGAPLPFLGLWLWFWHLPFLDSINVHIFIKIYIYLECKDCRGGLLQIEVMMESFVVYATVCVINPDDSPSLCSMIA